MPAKAIIFAAACGLGAPAIAKPCITPVDVPQESQTNFVAINNAGTIAGNVTDTASHGVIRSAYGVFTIFDPPGAVNTFVNAIDAAGDTVGSFATASGPTDCFIRSASGVYTIFGPMQGRNAACNATGINSKFLVAGTVIMPHTEYGFLRASAGGIRAFLAHGSDKTAVLGINGAATIIGSTQRGTGSAGFLRLRNGSILYFHAQGDTYGTFATCISNTGVIAGYYADSSNDDHGFVRQTDGAITVFSIAGTYFLDATAINARNQIIGNYETGTDGGSFVREADGSIKTFAVANAARTFAAAINDSGVIVGSYIDAQGKAHGFIRTP